MDISNLSIRYDSGAPKASPEAVAAFLEWIKAFGIEISKSSASIAYVNGKCAADFEPKQPSRAG